MTMTTAILMAAALAMLAMSAMMPVPDRRRRKGGVSWH
jgi:hypothetical protein